MSSLKEICSGLPLDPLPPNQGRDPNVPHAPIRTPNLTAEEERLALRNALRYFPPSHHATLASEFAQELRQYGHIYMYRFCPTLRMRAYPIDQYPCRTRQAAAMMLMIMNNLDPAVAQFPQELVTYGGNGQVFSNWAQVWPEGTNSGYVQRSPHGSFPQSAFLTSRIWLTNVIPNYSSRDQYEKMFAMGVSMYGQMTAGSYCYIGPQGIVHGTMLTVLNAGRRYLGSGDLRGRVFVTSGLGGMSGAQAKAAVIAGCVGVIAEVDEAPLRKRHEQGWLMEVTSSLDQCIKRISTYPLQSGWWAAAALTYEGQRLKSWPLDRLKLGRPQVNRSAVKVTNYYFVSYREAKSAKTPLSLGYHGNVVDLWERILLEFERTGELLVDLGSDQTSLHNPYNGGYYPVQLSFQQANQLMSTDPDRFRNVVQESLRRQIKAINKLADAGMHFWDYGNAFLLEAQRAGAEVQKVGGGATEFRYPSYVQHIMGDIFSLGFGPFRWVCTSGNARDLAVTDNIAATVLEEMSANVPERVKQQYNDNIRWIREAGKHKMVVGSQARILYSDQKGRVSIALAINQAVADGNVSAPVVISRDHHDVSGTDSPFRETSNVYDGSVFCADMAVQNFVGDAFRGATWVALHNGGGVGWGEVINGGFGLVLDGSEEAAKRARLMLNWDVSNGVARRCWSGNSNAYETIQRTMEENRQLLVTMPFPVQDEHVLDRALQG
uniref:Urocanate hydratase 1 n=1 Tax=Oreochromis niloticus TaxID=8128 RepID=A0A669D900_ORENI